MARKIKQVISECGTDRRNTGYYSTPLPIARYIASRLFEINPNGKTLIDPCIGKEELVQTFFEKGVLITGIDVIDHGINKKCQFINEDFLGLYKNYKTSDIFNTQEINLHDFDFWVANPPYNCHEVDYIRNNKRELKKTFNDVGVHNMYSMFISAIIDMSKEGAIIGLITLDSFLTSKAHKELRKKILDTCIIHDLLLCPTDLFLDQGADVRTCIFIIEKNNKNTQYQGMVRLLNRQLNKHDFFESLEKKSFEFSYLDEIVLKADIDNNELLIGVPDEIKSFFSNKRIGDLFKCVTGISTGNDGKYLSNKKADGFTIPFYKNPGSRKFYCEPDGYLIDSFLEEKNINNFTIRNLSLLYQQGITCSSMGVEFSACYLPKNSTYGVNPNIICDEKEIWWMLAFLNSNLVKYTVRGILIRTNMVTSGYVARIPVPKFCEEEKLKLTILGKEAYETAKKDPKEIHQYINSINELIFNKLNLSNGVRDILNEFCANIVKRA